MKEDSWNASVCLVAIAAMFYDFSGLFDVSGE